MLIKKVKCIWNIDARIFMRYGDVDTVMGLEAVMVTTIWSGLEWQVTPKKWLVTSSGGWGTRRNSHSCRTAQNGHRKTLTPQVWSQKHFIHFSFRNLIVQHTTLQSLWVLNSISKGSCHTMRTWSPISHNLCKFQVGFPLLCLSYLS